MKSSKVLYVRPQDVDLLREALRFAAKEYIRNNRVALRQVLRDYANLLDEDDA